jgi:hypothetical protein
MAEITPSGIIVTGNPTDVKGSVEIGGTRETLENMYNDFLDYKQVGTIALDVRFDSYIRDTINMLKHGRKQGIYEDYCMGKIGRAVYDTLEEYRLKLIGILEKAEPTFWGFDNYGIQYIQPEQRHLYKEKVGKNEMVVPNHRPVKIKTSMESGIIGA